jgi:hypothetical protein
MTQRLIEILDHVSMGLETLDACPGDIFEAVTPFDIGNDYDDQAIEGVMETGRIFDAVTYAGLDVAADYQDADIEAIIQQALNFEDHVDTGFKTEATVDYKLRRG